MLQVSNVEVVYSEVILVLKNISVAVADKGIVAVLGANGAGKSTLLKAISGLLITENGEVTEGSIMWDGTRIEKMTPEERVKLGIAQIMEGRMVFTHLTVEENLEVGHYVQRNKTPMKNDIEKVYGYFPRLREMRRSIAGYLSGGEQQMLVIGRGLMSSPRLFLLDEPSMGLAPIVVEEIFRIVTRMQQDRGMAILLVEQNAYAALSIADHGFVMENGKIVLDAPSTQLLDNPDVKEFYVGIGDRGERK